MNVIVVIGEESDLSWYVYRNLRIPKTDIIFSPFTSIREPCPPEIVTGSAEEMRKWSISSCLRGVDTKNYNKTIITTFDLFSDYNHIFEMINDGETATDKRLSFIESDCYFTFQHILTIEEDKLFSNVSFPDSNLKFNTTETSPIIMIPSVINIQNSSRSLFTKAERLEHTIRQLRSIRSIYPNAFSVILEASVLTLKEVKELSQAADHVILFHKDDEAMFHAHSNPNKNGTEVYMLSRILSKIHDNTPFSHICKFGGRYWFSDENDLFKSIPVMKIINGTVYNQPIIEPVFYSVPAKFSMKFLTALYSMESILRSNFSDVERLLWNEFASDMEIENPSNLGIKGYTATTRIFRYF